MGHDLVRMADEGVQLGLHIDQRQISQMETIERLDDYVKARYTAVSIPGTPGIGTALEIATSLRETVRLALDYDDFGMPTGPIWPDGEPADLIAAREQWSRESVSARK